MRGHVPNSLFIPYGGATFAGGDKLFPTWCKWVLPKDKRVILVCDMEKSQHISSISKLHLAGFDNIIGYLDGGQETWASECAEGSDVFYTPEDLDNNGVINNLENTESQVLDVRKPVEWKEDGVFTNAKLLELAHITKAVNKDVNKTGLDKNETIYFLCRGGVRSVVAMSWFRIHGFKDGRNIVGGKNLALKQNVPLHQVDLDRQTIKI